MKRFLPVAAGVGVVLALAALASYITTSVHLLSCLPAGEVRLKVIDRNGQPVKGAVLRVYQEGSRDLAYEYPLDNHLPGQDLTSNDSGVIVAIRKHSPQFCVHAWWLFWVIPMGEKVAEYDCEITADGYQPLQFRFHRLFKSPYTDYHQFPKTTLHVDGKDIELPIFENTFVLEK